MIDCKFVYMYSSGSASDSLQNKFSVPAVPRVGDPLLICGHDSNCISYVVTDVLHSLDMKTGLGEVIVYYKSAAV